MRKLLLNGGAALIASTSFIAWPLMAADHVDSPQATANPTADIDDVFAWMSPDTNNVNLVMTIGRDVGPNFQFSDAVEYIFRVRSRSGLLASEGIVTTDVRCTFTVSQQVTCTAGDASIQASAAVAGSEAGANNGQLRVFAGQRNDPFFFNLSGFRATAETVTMAAGDLNFDDAGCPLLDSATSNALVTQLQSEPDGSAGQDDFEGFNVQALVLQVNTNLLNAGGSILGVSGFTNTLPEEEDTPDLFGNGG